MCDTQPDNNFHMYITFYLSGFESARERHPPCLQCKVTPVVLHGVVSPDSCPRRACPTLVLPPCAFSQVYVCLSLSLSVSQSPCLSVWSSGGPRLARPGRARLGMTLELRSSYSLSEEVSLTPRPKWPPAPWLRPRSHQATAGLYRLAVWYTALVTRRRRFPTSIPERILAKAPLKPRPKWPPAPRLQPACTCFTGIPRP